MTNRTIHEIEIHLVEQEHRTFSIIKNLIKYGFNDNEKKKSRAAWFAFIFNLLFSKSTIALGLAGAVGWYIGFRSNDLLQAQNHLIKEQTKLIEAERRSSLIFLMGNIMDKIDEELKNNNKSRELSPQLIGRIAALSHSLKPYYFLKDSILIEKPLSPERGQLLMSIVNAELDSITLVSIFKKSSFAYADLEGVPLRDAKLYDINLRYANLKKCDLIGANLWAANLWDSDCRGAYLNGAYLVHTDFRGANLTGARMNKAVANMSYMTDAILKNVNFEGTDLRNASFISSVPAEWSLKQIDSFRIERTVKVLSEVLSLKDAKVLESAEYDKRSLFIEQEAKLKDPDLYRRIQEDKAKHEEFTGVRHRELIIKNRLLKLRPKIFTEGYAERMQKLANLRNGKIKEIE